MAEREGFEPSIRCYTYTRFPSVRLQPLGHLSATWIRGFWGSIPIYGNLPRSINAMRNRRKKLLVHPMIERMFVHELRKPVRGHRAHHQRDDRSGSIRHLDHENEGRERSMRHSGQKRG